ncbi:chaperone modulator CbpM [Microbulbifer agarilyticus]|uniref:chaperone modulator CbpM n=1 Tax=Microbulbifer agarilyticus TaxID=260552 RepID=UPI001CD62678|nr:chaperone modulator CbpM [Microbulbifer agarilyticus]MCA0901231.1 chaperone modulator CbpM [Microbulbifer agarilyticus]
MQSDDQWVGQVEILDEQSRMTLRELCAACGLSAEQVMSLVDQGVIDVETRGGGVQFSGICVRRVRRVYRLERDLGVNHAGAALALELLDEIEQLRARIRRLERR